MYYCFGKGLKGKVIVASTRVEGDKRNQMGSAIELKTKFEESIQQRRLKGISMNINFLYHFLCYILWKKK